MGVFGSVRNNTVVPKISISQGTTRIALPTAPLYIPDDDNDDNNPHEKGVKTFARIYTNELAFGEIYKNKPVFPAGAMIVREKLLNEKDEIPELVTVMLKHERGFSPTTNDWEYFVLDSNLSKIKKSEKVGDCSKCHAGAAETDMVFKTYLK